jgi:DNA-directed RNA polymerase specialized sigma24 family protein
MSTVAWIAAEAECPLGELFKSSAEDISDSPQSNPRVQENSSFSEEEPAGRLQNSAEELENAAWALYEEQRQRRIYRARTVTMLRRYMRYSIETGRLPSLVGREFFRSKITKYQIATFEDRVIFVLDMEKCLEQLDDFGRQVLGRIVLQEYGQEDAARSLGCTRMTVHRKLLESLDQLSDILVSVDLLDALRPGVEKSCQGGKEDDFLLSSCEDGK